jgi:DNA-binding NarL/FixJ family response regulator
MSKTLNVLIVEDEPLIINILITALNQITESKGIFDFNIKSATDCDAANLEIQKAVRTKPLDLVLLDISLPASKDGKLLSGEDLGIEVRHFFPEVKIIVFTSHNNNYRLNNILKSLNPDGFIIKSDIDFNKLLEALNAVLEEMPYYSKAVLQLMRRHIFNDFTLDKIDRQILYQLSKGAKTKHLTDTIPLSTSAIEARKRNLKELFGVDQGDDRNLILKAEERGFI